MVTNPEKRKKTYQFYDEKYQESEEEKEILNLMTERRKWMEKMESFKRSLQQMQQIRKGQAPRHTVEELLAEIREEIRFEEKIRVKLEGQPVRYKELIDYAPEKVEIIDGEIIGGEKLLQLLIYNLGVEKVCEYIPSEMLEQVFEKKKNSIISEVIFLMQKYLERIDDYSQILEDCKIFEEEKQQLIVERGTLRECVYDLNEILGFPINDPKPLI